MIFCCMLVSTRNSTTTTITVYITANVRLNGAITIQSPLLSSDSEFTSPFTSITCGLRRGRPDGLFHLALRRPSSLGTASDDTMPSWDASATVYETRQWPRYGFAQWRFYITCSSRSQLRRPLSSERQESNIELNLWRHQGAVELSRRKSNLSIFSGKTELILGLYARDLDQDKLHVVSKFRSLPF